MSSVIKLKVIYLSVFSTVVVHQIRHSGMWSRSRRLGLETVSRRTNVSSRSRLGQSAQRLDLVLVREPRPLKNENVAHPVHKRFDTWNRSGDTSGTFLTLLY